jgi:hypothetical protein
MITLEALRYMHKKSVWDVNLLSPFSKISRSSTPNQLRALLKHRDTLIHSVPYDK